jgi:hypothetical protein
VRSPFTLERVARALAWTAGLSFAFAAAWGIDQTPGGGDSDSGSAGTTGASWAIAHFKIAYPSGDWYALTPPGPETYYCHHPFGVFYFSVLFLWTFGHRDFVVHLAPVLMSIAIPPLLYGIGSRHRGPAVGAVSAYAYVVVPIAIGFANYNNLETPAIFGSLLFFWGHTVHQATGEARHLAASLAGLAVTAAPTGRGTCWWRRCSAGRSSARSCCPRDGARACASPCTRAGGRCRPRSPSG